MAAASQSGVEFYNQFVKLTADLDFSNDSVPAIGSISSPFYGTFDGDNHTVTAKLTTNVQSQGLIGVLSGGTVKTLMRRVNSILEALLVLLWWVLLSRIPPLKLQ